MNPDLTAARSTIESTMTDECLITFDAGGTHDDILDPTTLRLSRPAGDTTTIYAGKCSVYPDNTRPAPTVEGGEPRALLHYIVAIPADAAIPPAGSTVHITETGDPGLQDALLRVTSVIGRTHVVMRKLRCELRQQIRDRP